MWLKHLPYRCEAVSLVPSGATVSRHHQGNSTVYDLQCASNFRLCCSLVCDSGEGKFEHCSDPWSSSTTKGVWWPREQHSLVWEQPDWCSVHYPVVLRDHFYLAELGRNMQCLWIEPGIELLTKSHSWVWLKNKQKMGEMIRNDGEFVISSGTQELFLALGSRVTLGDAWGTHMPCQRFEPRLAACRADLPYYHSGSWSMLDLQIS